jgi:hypothetical protein
MNNSKISQMNGDGTVQEFDPKKRRADRANGKAAAEPDGKAATEPDGKAATEPNGKAAAEPDGKAATGPDGKAATEPNGKAATEPSGLAHPNRFRISQNYADHIQTRKKAVLVPLRKPDPQEWVFIHPGKDWRESVGVLEDKINREIYVVEPRLLPEITEVLIPKLLAAYFTRSGSLGLWPIRLPNESGRQDTYNRSALEIVERYAGQWIRVLTSESNRCYEILEMASTVEMPTPKWPDGGFPYLFEIAFKANIIASLEHPLLKTLRGEQ